ncbi:hypothetical protein [Rhizobium sp. 21-4511-3d]
MADWIVREIIPNEFPELKMLAWSRDTARPIPADEAYALYERNWRFVDASALTEAEAELIRGLTRAYGNGVLLVS